MNNRYRDIQNTRLNIDTEDWRIKDFSNPKGLIRLGTTFSGIGAIEYALKRLGLNYKISFAGDIDADCKASYFANYDIREDQWHSDVHDFDASVYQDKIDLLVGGAPCQAFSMRGKRGGFDDTRGTLFREFARVVMECKPKVFIFENVRGMLNHDKGRTWNTILETFERDCNYQVYYQILNGKDYGIPQSRSRLFCIGFLNETEFKFPCPISLGAISMYDFLEKEFNKKYLLKHKGVHFVTEQVNRDKSYTQINGEVMLCQKRNQQFNWHGDFVFHPLLISDKSTPNSDPTVFDSTFGETDYYTETPLEKYPIVINGDICKMTTSSEINRHRGRFRKLTPSECLKLMGFVDGFNIVVSDTAIYKQSGNSIIVDVLIALLKQMDITKYSI